MVRVRSLAKDLRQLEKQKQATAAAAAVSPASPSPSPAGSATGSSSAPHAAPGSATEKPLSSSSALHPTDGTPPSSSSTTSPHDPAAVAGDAPACTSADSSPLCGPPNTPPPPQRQQHLRSSSSSSSGNNLFSLGGSRFDILVHGNHGEGGAPRKSQVRKAAAKACAGGASVPSQAPPRRPPQDYGTEDISDADEAVNPAPPLGDPSGIPTKAPYKRLLAQPFSHVLVCDFEATCASGSVHYPHEIIEFPVVVLDTATLRIVAEFHRYVRPVRNPRLTAFCTELTGITQDMVDAADPLPAVVEEFQAWLEAAVYPLCRMWANYYGPAALSHSLKTEQRRFVYDERTDVSRANVASEAMLCMATDGPWDMRRFMHECGVLRDGVDFPPVCYRYINVRHSYSDHFKCKQVKLTHMLRKLSMSFEGRRHSGIDDTRNIARVLAELFARGYRVHHISTIKYAHRGDAFLESNQAAQELLSEYGEMDETHTSKRANTRNTGKQAQRGGKKA